MFRTSLTAFIALTLISSTAQASPYTGAVQIAAAPGYAAPGEAPPPAEVAPAPAPTPTPQPYAQPDPYAQPQPQPYAQPQPYQEQEKPRRRGKGLMIAGWSMFGAMYLTTAFVGAAVYDASGTVCDLGGGDSCRRPGLPLVIPVVGPLVNIGTYDSVSLATLGIVSFLVQAAGLSMGIAGTVMFVKDGKRNRAQQVQQAGLHIGRGVHLRAAPRLDGGSLNLSYRF